MAENFYEWSEVFPELRVLRDNVAALLEEAETVAQWTPWPEDLFAANALGQSAHLEREVK